MKIGFVTGLKAEAALLRGFYVETGDGTQAGARAAAERLVLSEAQALISFGLAGGLSPGLVPGTLLVPSSVIEDGITYACDPNLMAYLGGATDETILSGQAIAATAAEKSALFTRYSTSAIDLESGAVATIAAAHNLPFAVLRAIADPADRTLPPAALIPLQADGAINLPAILRSVARSPSQIPSLIALARDAAYARRALMGAISRILKNTKTNP